MELFLESRKVTGKRAKESELKHQQMLHILAGCEPLMPHYYVFSLLYTSMARLVLKGILATVYGE